jgi:hypothetical protein
VVIVDRRVWDAGFEGSSVGDRVFFGLFWGRWDLPWPGFGVRAWGVEF